jgi:hypothetical protein
VLLGSAKAIARFSHESGSVIAHEQFIRWNGMVRDELRERQRSAAEMGPLGR